MNDDDRTVYGYGIETGCETETITLTEEQVQQSHIRNRNARLMNAAADALTGTAQRPANIADAFGTHPGIAHTTKENRP